MTYKQVIDDITQTATPAAWIGWLLSIQNHLIRTGYFEASTEKHLIDHTEKVESLKGLFDSL